MTVQFEPRGDEQTLMTIEHSLLPPDLVDQHEDGWERTATQLSSKLLAYTSVQA